MYKSSGELQKLTLIDQITFPLFILWIIGLFLVTFRRDIDFLWKVTFLFIFVFYFFQFYPDFMKGYERLMKNYPAEVVQWIFGIGKASYYFLLIVWPVSLIRMFYSGSESLSRTLIIVLITSTMIFWIIFFFWSKYEAEIDAFLYGPFTRLISI
ncbi:MAG: hypothetical protein K8R21_14685 [Leptospira sp.]|nr:hypothetical protein [Leptospira sp.]